jgi:hypothetical protein
MGVARLLAKGWVVFCLFAAAHALDFALRRGEPPMQASSAIVICMLLFGAMGLLFIGGFGASSAGGPPLLRARLRLRVLVPSFDGGVFLAFVVTSFVVQTYFITAIGGSAVAQALQKAMYFIVPGLPALVQRLSTCSDATPYVYSLTLASAVAWLLAIVFVASSVSRIGLTAGLLRLERALHPQPFSPTVLAALYGIAAVVGFQLLYVGSAYPWLGCSAFTGITGAALIGLAPLMLAYLVFAALATLRASGPAN